MTSDTDFVQYCANDSDCSSLSYSPPSDNVCVKGTSSTSESYHIWEGSSQSCTFPTGVTFTWNIPSSAQSQPNYSSVGYVPSSPTIPVLVGVRMVF